MTTTYCFLETEKISDIIDMSSDRNTYVGLENKAGSEIDPLCEMCTLEWHDPKPEDLVMYLHAYRYQGPDWEFRTPLPHWANLPDTNREGNQSWYFRMKEMHEVNHMWIV